MSIKSKNIFYTQNRTKKMTEIENQKINLWFQAKFYFGEWYSRKKMEKKTLEKIHYFGGKAIRKNGFGILTWSLKIGDN